MSLQAIIVGSSHAGANVAYNLRKDGFNGKIDLFTKEKIFPYQMYFLEPFLFSQKYISSLLQYYNKD